jgi:hypothetical protein
LLGEPAFLLGELAAAGLEGVGVAAFPRHGQRLAKNFGDVAWKALVARARS